MMKELVIEKTVKTPYVNFDPNTGILKITGRSIPENPEEFYNKLFDWIEKYFKNPQQETTIEIQLEYINSGSSKFILEFFQLIQDFHLQDKKCQINWYYEEDDEAVFELGKHYQSLINVPFELIETY
ncbi:MAG: hypothetical protein PWP52_1163 [Bacteroidales bacterium]|nr:hypothetical protein [Bacteroidales bacterium]